MKTGLLSDEDDLDKSPSVAQRVGHAAAALKALIGGSAGAHRSEAWLAGYNAFYEGSKGNPYPAGTGAHGEWELGSKAFEQDFEW